MKSSQKINPSKYDILNWINNLLPKTVKKVTSIQHLGSGAAYLHALNLLRPGSVRTDRIINQPQNQYEICCNLKLLSSLFEKLSLQHSFEIEKVAQMKYQDNYHLAAFLFKLHASEHRQPQSSLPDNLLKTAQPAKKVKIVLPRNPISHPLKKHTTTPITQQAILQLKTHSNIQLQRIQEPTPLPDPTKSQKLSKIATILNLQRKDQQVFSEKAKSQIVQKPEQPRLNSITESFKRFLRPSICERSKYIKEFVDENVPRHNFQASLRWDAEVKSNENNNYLAREEGVEQLLSQRKVEGERQMNREEISVEQKKMDEAIMNEGETEKQDESLMFGI